MTSQGPVGGRSRQVFPTLPRGEVVATFETYPEAQSAVEVLVKGDFPVAQVSIVGSDLKTVERVTGKLSWGRVAAAGAASGVWLGIFFGLLLLIFSPATNFGVLLAALLLGAGFGILFGLVSYAITRRRRDYTSMTQVLATSYSIIVDPELANRARNLVGTQPGSAFVPPAGGAPFAPPPEHPSDPPAAPTGTQSSGRPEIGNPGGDSETGESAGGQAPRHDEPPRYGERTAAEPPRFGERVDGGSESERRD
ncbi:general stress protein [Rathayibacter sp. CAU 1779]